MTTALAIANQRRSCENCRTLLVPYGAEVCWACGGPSVAIVAAREPGQRTTELVALGGGLGGGLAFLVSSADSAVILGAAAGAAVFGVVAMILRLVTRLRVARQVPAGAGHLLGASPSDDASRTRLHAAEAEVVRLLGQVASGLAANADAVASRGGQSSSALDQARATLLEVRARYEAHLADTLVALELVAVAGWLRRMSALVALPIADAEQARAVIARYDGDLAEARAPTFPRRAQLAATSDPAITIIAREGNPALGIRSELATALPARLAEPWTRAIDAATSLRAELTDRLELVAVRAAADVAGQVHLIDNPERPMLALTATQTVVGSLEAEVARLLEESDRIRAESDALREVDEALAG